MQVDSRLLRHKDYKQWWIDKENQKYAEQLHGLLAPAYEQLLGRDGTFTNGSSSSEQKQTIVKRHSGSVRAEN